MNRLITHQRRGLNTLFLVLVVLASLASASPSSAWAATDAEAQAARQLELAREELADGRPERALLSTTSALRLDPALYEALLVKALAYEQTGDVTRAMGLVVAYSDLAGSLALPEATEVQTRLEQLQQATDLEPAPVPVLTRTRVLARDRTRALVLFRAESELLTPLLHWRKPGGAWQEGEMKPIGDGEWELRVVLTDFRGGTIQYWVEGAEPHEVIAARGR